MCVCVCVCVYIYIYIYIYIRENLLLSQVLELRAAQPLANLYADYDIPTPCRRKVRWTYNMSVTNRQAEKQTDRERDRQTDRQT